MTIMSAFRIYFTNLVNTRAFVPQQIHLRGIHSTLCQQQKLKTIEERAGLPTKPKRPLSGYLRFVKEHSAPVKETNPQLSHRECLLHIGKMWNSISLTQKEEYSKPYKDEKSNYLAQMIVYNRSLTEDDKRSIREARAKIVARRAELTRSKQRRELGKPKKPANGYLKFRAERLRSRDLVDGKQTKEEFCKYIRESNNDWRALSDAERARYKTTPAELEEYKKAKLEWVANMIKIGRYDVIGELPKATPAKSSKAEESS